MENNPSYFGGLSGITADVDCFEFAEGITLRRTYAHLMSTNVMAFSPAPPGQHHPAPWRAAQGGFAFDINVEIAVSADSAARLSLTPDDTLWLVAALLRLEHPYVSVPVIADMSFSDAAASKAESTLRPFEIEQRLFRHGGDFRVSLFELEWVQRKLEPVAKMLARSSAFNDAMRALDQANVRGRTSASMLATWGALEQLFSPSRGELRFRVSSYSATYLEGPGARRLALYKQLLHLYDVRSKAAHTATSIESAPLAQSYIILRNALVKMVEEENVPSQLELEAKLFSPTAPQPRSGERSPD
jgi:hypothetical protein